MRQRAIEASALGHHFYLYLHFVRLNCMKDVCDMLFVAAIRQSRWQVVEVLGKNEPIRGTREMDASSRHFFGVHFHLRCRSQSYRLHAVHGSRS